MGNYPHEWGPTSCPAIPEPVCLLPEMGTFHLGLFQTRTDDGEQTAHPHPQAQTNQRPVNYIEDHQRDSNSGSDMEYVFHTGKVKNLPYFDVSFGDGHQMFNVLADSGATHKHFV